MRHPARLEVRTRIGVSVAARPSIEIEIHSRESCIVTLLGEHDTATSEGVSLALTLARDYSHVLVDLTPCTFLDGAIINALLAGEKPMRAADGALELIAPDQAGAVRRTLELAGVLRLLPIHRTRSEGLAAVATAERLRAHSKPVSLRVVKAKVDHLDDKTEASAAIHAAKPRGLTVVRAQVEASAIESSDEARRRRAA
jgi:anti-anti-sigma factor